MTSRTEGWRTTSLRRIAEFKSGGTPDRQETRFWGGSVPWVSAKDMKSKELSDSSDKLTEFGAAKIQCIDPGTVLILVRGMALHKDIPMGIATKRLGFNQDVKALIPTKDIHPLYLLNVLLSQKSTILQAVESAGHGTGRLDTDFLKSLSVPLPPLPEQRRIANILATWDRAINALGRQIVRKEEVLSYLRDALIHGVRRLAAGTKPWPMVKLGDVTRHLTERNGGRFTRDRVMGVTKADGIVPMKEHVIADDIARYLILPPGAFAYNPMRLNIGSIVMSKLDEEVIVSPDYVVFSCTPERLLPGFLTHLRRTKAWADFMAIAGTGSVRVRIYYASLADLEFHLPSLPEQKVIIEVLDDAEREIDALTAECRALEKQRDALAPELLTGRLRVPDAANPAVAV